LGRIRPDQAGSSQTDAEPVEVEPVNRHGVPDDRGYPSVGKLQPTWTPERLAELQKADPDVAIIREWLEARVERTCDRVMPCSIEVKAYVSQWKSLIIDDGVVYGKFERPAGGVLFYQLLLFQDMRVGAPMNRVELDLTGPHVSIKGLTYICTAMCSFTKFVVAWPIRDKKATTVARGLMERVILPLVSFRELLTDSGKEFENELCHELCRLMG